MFYINRALGYDFFDLSLRIYSTIIENPTLIFTNNKIKDMKRYKDSKMCHLYIMKILSFSQLINKIRVPQSSSSFTEKKILRRFLV